MRTADGGAPAIPIIDTHHHLWDLDLLPYAWLAVADPIETRELGDYSQIRASYSLEHYLRDTAGCGVIQSVHVQSAYSGPDPVLETAWLDELSANTALPSAFIVACDLRAADVERQLDRHCAFAAVRGVRTFTEGVALLSTPFARGVAAIGERGLCYEFHLTHSEFDRAAQLAHHFPGVQFVVEHAGRPQQRDDEYRRSWQAGLRGLAELPNTVVKLSGLGMNDHRWTAATIAPWVLDCVEIFGPQRCMFGSNWPIDSLYSNYPQLVAAYRSILGQLTLAERHRIWHENAREVYRLDQETR